MAVTVKESKAILGEDDEYEKTRSGTANLKESITKSSQESSETNGDTEKPKLPRDGTMKVTTKEAKDYLGEDDREKTRKQTQEAAENDDKTDKPSVNRTATMVATAEEGASILGGEDLGKTRSQTEKANTPSKSPTTLKRTGTMAETAKEGEEFLKRTKLSSEDGAATSESNSNES
ncbi:hypothetical protein [Salmonella sp. s54836]|uniref:hypothetical protein n=1 Tax=Salmonella sp. s54836 TaxID=3159673 RepID=UPI00397EA7AF